MFMSCNSCRKSPKAFSLVELLAVVTMVGVIAGISSASLLGNGGRNRLTTASLQCANLFESARETAILKKNPVAVAIFQASQSTPVAFTALEYRPATKTWERISQWEQLSSGVLLDPDIGSSQNSLTPENSPTVTPSLPPITLTNIKYEPRVSNGYSYLVFLPSGALYQSHSHPGQLRFINGAMTTTGIRRTGPAEHFVDLVVNPSTGRLKIVKPD